MRPRIDSTRFGSITIAGEVYDHDVVIRLDGEVSKRKKKLSKEAHGTSHIVSLAEAEQVYEKGAERLIFGTGQSGMASLSEEASAYFQKHGCRAELMPTPQAVRAWNEAKREVVGLFHVTC